MAKKRYHQSKRDRMHEREGMEYSSSHKPMYREHAGYRSPVSPAMGNELSGMVHEDFSKPSNLPTNVVQKPYPAYNSVVQNYNYDTLMDATAAMNEGARVADRHKKKYGRY
jgi:hypothetical protein